MVFKKDSQLLGEKRSIFMTLKEHPVLAGRVVYYLHGCNMTQVVEGGTEDDVANRIVKWCSTVMPTVFGVELVDLELMKLIMRVE